MLRTMMKILVLALATSMAGPLQAQVASWDPSQPQVTRADLEDLLRQYEDVVASDGYSAQLRASAARSAERIRERLTEGDFRVGDRIALRIDEEAATTDTLVVEPGPALIIPLMGTIPLKGVLRSELGDHLMRELSVYLVDPVVYSAATIRLRIDGGVGQPGFYVFSADILLSDALMRAGGVGQAELDKMTVYRGDDILLREDELEQALQFSRSLDQLGLRDGDRLDVPVNQPSRIWPQVLRWGLVIASTTLLGFRLYR